MTKTGKQDQEASQPSGQESDEWKFPSWRKIGDFEPSADTTRAARFGSNRTDSVIFRGKLKHDFALTHEPELGARDVFDHL